MKRFDFKLGSYLPTLLLLLPFLLLISCDSDSDGDSNKTAEITNYIGGWYSNGIGTGTEEAVKSLDITADLSYVQMVTEFASTSKENEISLKQVSGTITDITTDEDNADYETIFLDIIEVEHTPLSVEEAADWNAKMFGGGLDWSMDVTKTFNSDNPGEWEHGFVWQSNIAVSVKKEGDLLVVNERGGFDGEDPPEDTYFISP